MATSKNIKFLRFKFSEAEGLGSNILSGLSPEITALGEEPVVYEIEKKTINPRFWILSQTTRELNST